MKQAHVRINYIINISRSRLIITIHNSLILSSCYTTTARIPDTLDPDGDEIPLRENSLNIFIYF